jgi:hypothetical protein
VTGVSSELLCHHNVGGQHNVNTGLVGFPKILGDSVDLVGFQQASPHCHTFRGKNGEHHSAAN